MTKDPSNFYLNQDEPNRSCLLTLRSMILNIAEIEETVKYGMPCFCFRKKALVYLWTDKKTKEPYILFVDGNLMSHHLLKSGERKRMKTLSVDPTEDLDVITIEALLREAIILKAESI